VVSFSSTQGHAEYWKWRSAKPTQAHHSNVVEVTDSGDRADLQRFERAVPH
jgi:hypothetical protein